MTSPARPIAQDAALFAGLAILADGLFSSQPMSPQSLPGAVHLALFVHLGFTVYLGLFPTCRAVTWMLLIMAWASSDIAVFGGLILQWGRSRRGSLGCRFCGLPWTALR